MRLTKWLSRKPYTKATWIMAITSCIMVLTLLQNHHVIRQNAEALRTAVQSLNLQALVFSNATQQLEIEKKTRLHPELQCAWEYIDLTNNQSTCAFFLRNIGTASATNICVYGPPVVACVTSNHVFTFQVSGGTRSPSSLEGKTELLPGEQAKLERIK
jgi:hypothetical protein